MSVKKHITAGMIFNNKEWLALFLTVNYTITGGMTDVIFMETSKVSISVYN